MSRARSARIARRLLPLVVLVTLVILVALAFYESKVGGPLTASVAGFAAGVLGLLVVQLWSDRHDGPEFKRTLTEDVVVALEPQAHSANGAQRAADAQII